MTDNPSIMNMERYLVSNREPKENGHAATS